MIALGGAGFVMSEPHPAILISAISSKCKGTCHALKLAKNTEVTGIPECADDQHVC